MLIQLSFLAPYLSFWWYYLVLGVLSLSTLVQILLIIGLWNRIRPLLAIWIVMNILETLVVVGILILLNIYLVPSILGYGGYYDDTFLMTQSIPAAIISSGTVLNLEIWMTLVILGAYKGKKMRNGSIDPY